MNVEAGGGTRDAVECAACGKMNSDHLVECAACRALLPIVIRRSWGDLEPQVTSEIRKGTIVASRYEVIEPLRKKIFKVFKAKDLRDGNTVLLTILRWDLDHRPKRAREFHLAIDRLCKVRHPNICAIYEYGEERGINDERLIRYIVSEHAEGTELATILKTGDVLPRRDAFAIAIAAAGGLQAVHDAGGCVLWLQPESIVRDSSGTVRLTDLASSMIADAEYAGDLTGPTGAHPHIAYCSPEMMEGDGSAASDIWSLAAIVFEMFTGQMLFGQQNPVALITQIVGWPVRLNESKLLPEALKPILSNALVRDPKARLSSAREFAAELRSVVAGQS